jgi:hypothetical protein
MIPDSGTPNQEDKDHAWIGGSPLKGVAMSLSSMAGGSRREAVTPTRLPPFPCASDLYQEQATGLPELVVHKVSQQRQSEDLQC